ncbi:hypothetical protein JCM14635_06220 [Megalodesulfovibrio paquesii]
MELWLAWVRRLPAGLFLTVLLMLLAGMLFFADSRTARLQRAHAEDVLTLTSQELQQIYFRILSERRLLLQQERLRLEQTAGMARRLVEYALQDALRQGLPPRETKDLAGPLALTLIDHVFLEPGLLCFVYDDRITALTYPELALRGLDLSPYRDRKGRSLLRTLRNEARQWGSTSAVFDWKARGAARMTLHLGVARHLPMFDWTLAVFLDAEGLQRRERDLRGQAATALLAKLAQTQDARQAVFCLLDNRGRLLGAPVTGLEASPPLVRASLNASMLANAEVQSRLLVAALSGEPAVLEELPGDPGPVTVAGVQHAALGWTVVRLEPVHTPASRWFWVPCALGALCFFFASRRSLQQSKDAS